MTPLERACIAITDELRNQGELMPGCGDPEWAQCDGAFLVEPIVRAVLKAFREPSDEMVIAGQREVLEPADPRLCWAAMIDVALEDGR